jgi:hypothetical protein
LLSEAFAQARLVGVATGLGARRGRDGVRELVEDCKEVEEGNSELALVASRRVESVEGSTHRVERTREGGLGASDHGDAPGLGVDLSRVEHV